MPKDFVISFTLADRDWAEWITWQLREAGYTTTFVGSDFRPGESFIQRMSETLSEADRVLAVLSPAYLESSFATYEWAASLATDPVGNFKLLPVRVAPVELPGLLATRAYIDLVGLDPAAAKARLLEGVATALPSGGRPHRGPAFPGTGERLSQVSVAVDKAQVDLRAPSSSDSSAEQKDGELQPQGTVFISYSHKDKRWLQRLLVHLKPLERQGVLDIWEDSRIKPGAPWREEIRKALEAARLAVLLISADFLASDFIMSDELPTLLRSAEEGGTIVIPLIVAPSRFGRTTSVSRFQAINSPDLPLTRLAAYQREELLVRLANSIEEALWNPRL
jgi:hypothetical protein